MKIALISCVSKKNPLAATTPVAAKDFYVSPLFVNAWKYAEQCVRPDRIYILSAKHGLVAPDTPLMTYNMTLNDANATQRRQWADMVVNQLRKEGVNLDKDEIVFLAGDAYRKDLMPQCKHASTPYEGLHGIGHILHFLKSNVK